MDNLEGFLHNPLGMNNSLFEDLGNLLELMKLFLEDFPFEVGGRLDSEQDFLDYFLLTDHNLFLDSDQPLVQAYLLAQALSELNLQV